MLQLQKILKTLWRIRTLFSLSGEVGIPLKGWNFPIWLLKVKSLNLQVWVNGVTMCHNDYQNHPFCIAKNSNYNFSCWRGSLQRLLLRRSWVMPFSCLRFQVMGPHFISIDDLWWKTFTVVLIMGEQTLCSCFTRCDSQSGFPKPNKHTIFNILRHQ